MSISRIILAISSVHLLAQAPVVCAVEAAGPVDAAAATPLRVEVTSLRGDRGAVYCTLYAAPGTGFPTNPSKAKASVRAGIRDRKSVCEFAEVGPGEYAVSVLHDENGNGKMDTDWMGIPKEGYGATRDARGSMGPPKFRDAAFTYKGGGLTLQVRMVYGPS
jgi:uncharacterized protein (DUF2141 family)